MGLVVPSFAVAFNALLWLARVGLGPAVSARAGNTAAWIVAALAPLALLAIATRLRLARASALLFVAAASLALATALAG